MLISRKRCFVVCSQVLRSGIWHCSSRTVLRTVDKRLFLTRIMQVQTTPSPPRPASLALGLGMEIGCIVTRVTGLRVQWGLFQLARHHFSFLSFPSRKRKTLQPLLPLLPSHLSHIVFSFSYECSESAIILSHAPLYTSSECRFPFNSFTNATGRPSVPCHSCMAQASISPPCLPPSTHSLPHPFNSLLTYNSLCLLHPATLL